MARPSRRAAPDRRRAAAEEGQATVELLAALPALLLAGLIALQLLAAGHAQSAADGAAEAAALAIAAGRPPAPAARAALAAWDEEDARVAVAGGRVAVTLRPPSPLGPLGGLLRVTSTAYARPR